MSSYDSTRSGHLHAQYQHQQPPYPTTPAPPSQPHNYFPPIPEQRPVYSSSPSQPLYSSSPQSPHVMMPQPQVRHHRTSSSSSYNSQQPSETRLQPMPIPARHPSSQQYQYSASYPSPATYGQQVPVYARSSSHQSQYSQHSEYAHNPHAYADGEDKYDGHQHQLHQHHEHHGKLDPETEAEYRRRYAKDQKLERRPTLGGSLYSAIGKVGKVFGSQRH